MSVQGCPRCGYDLTGLVGSWTLTCPLRVTCSECGLEFELRLVLNEALRERARFFEAAGEHLWRALLITTRRALAPWGFWRWVVLEYRPRLSRMVAGAAAGVALVQASLMAVVAAQCVLQWLVDTLTGRGQRWNPNMIVGWWSNTVRFAMPWELAYVRDDTVRPLLVLGLMVLAVMPAAFLLLPFTLRRARVRSMHLVRVGAWSLVGVPMILGLIALALLGLELISWLTGYLMPRQSIYIPTRAEEIIGAIAEPFINGLDRIFPSALLAWTVVWWGFAVGRYLKLPRPWLVTGVMALLSVLLAAALGFLIPPVRYAVGLRIWS